MAVALTSRKSTRDASTRAGLRFLCQTDLFTLARDVLNRDRPRNHLTTGFHRPICEFRASSPFRTNLIMVPRDHLKTALMTEAGTVQRILRDPESRTLIASNKAEAAEAMLAAVKGHLQNPLLLWAFPDILVADPARQAEKWTNSQVTVKRKRRPKEATVETIGVSGEVTSKHYDHGTFDDVVGLENSQTRDQLLATITWWRIAQSLFEPEATQDIIGTPWHYADLYGWLQEQKAARGMPVGIYKRACWEPGADGELRPTLPEKFTMAYLREIKETKGSAMFAAQYLIDPTDDETAVFPRKQAQGVSRDQVPSLDELWVAMTVDPAISTKAWADYSALAVGGFDREGTLWILDLRRGRWTESQLMHEVYDAASRVGSALRVVGFEVVGFQKIFRRLFQADGDRRGHYLPIVPLERDTKITKNVRIRALQPYWERGAVKLPSDLLALEDFLDEAERFRLTKESAHDDLLDAVVDLFQLRARPARSEDMVAIDEDPSFAERRQFERTLRPDLDLASRRMAWVQHQVTAQWEAQRQAMAVGVDVDEFWGG